MKAAAKLGIDNLHEFNWEFYKVTSKLKLQQLEFNI